MEEGLWKLFFATGLPQVYLAIRGGMEKEPQAEEKRAMTAFSAQKQAKEI